MGLSLECEAPSFEQLVAWVRRYNIVRAASTAELLVGLVKCLVVARSNGCGSTSTS